MNLSALSELGKTLMQLIQILTLLIIAYHLSEVNRKTKEK